MDNTLPTSLDLPGWSVQSAPSEYESPARNLQFISQGNSSTLTYNTGDGYVKLQSNLATKASCWIDWRGNIYYSSADNIFANKKLILQNVGGVVSIGGDASPLKFKAGNAIQMTIDNLGRLYDNASQPLLGPYAPGWTLPTGTLSRLTFDQSTVTLPQLAQRLAALITDLMTNHGLINS